MVFVEWGKVTAFLCAMNTIFYIEIDNYTNERICLTIRYLQSIHNKTD